MLSNPLPQEIVGHWHQHRYKVIRELGRGANGVVYQVERAGIDYACKCSSDITTLQMEINILQQLARTRDQLYGSFILEADDFMWSGTAIAFYIMPYFPGLTLDRWIAQQGQGAILPSLIQVLDRLQLIHEAGYAFGDIKPANILVLPATGEVVLIDFGGVTPFGHGIRQYTEQYDQGRWKGASRRARASYDLFSVSILFLELLLQGGPARQELTKSDRGLSHLEHVIQKHVESRFRKVLLYGLRGQYASAAELRQQMVELAHELMAEQRGEPLPTGKGLVMMLLLGASLLYLLGYWLQV